MPPLPCLVSRNVSKCEISPCDFGNVGRGNAGEDTAAIQKAIDTAVNAPDRDPATRVRQAVYAVNLGLEDYLIHEPIRATSVNGLSIYGCGSRTRLIPAESMETVLDLNGFSNGYAGHFQVGGNGASSGGIYVDYGMLLRSDSATAARTSSKNYFEKISIRGFDWKIGLGISPVDKEATPNRQNDQSQWDSLTIDGSWGQGDDPLGIDSATQPKHVAAISVGNSSGAGNQLNHQFNNYVCVQQALALINNGVDVINIRGASFATVHSVLESYSSAKTKIDSFRSEGSSRLAVHNSGGRILGSMIFENGQVAVRELPQDEEWISWNGGAGILTLREIWQRSDPVTLTPRIAINSARPVGVRLEQVYAYATDPQDLVIAGTTTQISSDLYGVLNRGANNVSNIIL